VEVAQEGGVLQYKVHYAGWNIRYDEWIRRDRIVAVVERGSSGGGSVTHHTPPSQPQPQPKVLLYAALLGVLLFTLWLILALLCVPFFTAHAFGCVQIQEYFNNSCYS
jgi:hypothetical protein